MDEVAQIDLYYMPRTQTGYDEACPAKAVGVTCVRRDRESSSPKLSAQQVS